MYGRRNTNKIKVKKVNKMSIEELKKKMDVLRNQKSSLYYKSLESRLKELQKSES